jgi:predicted PurR-regulated permease PerM
MDKSIFNDRFRQIIVFAIIIIIALLLIKPLMVFLPGMLGALTLYIVSRSKYFQLIYFKKWKPGLTALLFVLGYVVIIAIPVYLSVTLISPKINELVSNQDKIVASVQSAANTISQKFNIKLLTPENIKTAATKVSALLPSLLSGTGGTLANLFMMFFFLYFLLVGGRSVEKNLNRLIPLKPQNISLLAKETKMMVRANALGIPLICVVQGITATIGYLIFGIEDWGLWGFLTGVFAFFPFVGTMIIWVPLCLFLFSQGPILPAVGLTLYNLLITGNVDYVARVTLMKKIGDVHPLITILGVVVGLELFGFIGLVFGPLLISYFLILIKIYINEFSVEDNPEVAEET